VLEQELEQLRTRVHARALDRFGCREDEIRIVKSPLRVSPLGAHVDHQDGLVTGMALDQAIYLAFAPREDGVVSVESANFSGRVTFHVDDVPPKVHGDWANYARGAVLAIKQSHEVRVGMDAAVMGTMPIGGLSSSAAVGVAYLLALEVVNGLSVSAEENIRLDRYIENTYLGLKNGVLDQSMILLSDRDCLTHLDCRTMEVQRIPTAASPDDFEVLVVHSGVRKALVGTDYNNRVNECQQAARLMLAWSGVLHTNGNSRLRSVSPEVYAAYGEQLPAPLDRRARHFFTELTRVTQGVAAWRAGEIDRMGRLMRESGASSVHNYESGSPYLTTLYEVLCNCPGVYGARFSGGGFRGSCIGLSDPSRREEIIEHIAAYYPAAHPDIAGLYSVHFCRTGEAARLLD